VFIAALKEMGRREEDLSKLWENFSLTEEEDEDFVVPKEAMVDLDSKGKRCLVGKLIFDRVIGKETVRSKVTKGWRTEGYTDFKELGDNLFLINFEYESDKWQVLKGQPWVFEGLLFLVEDFNGKVPPSQMKFETVPMWVRMYDLPLACMGKEMGYRLGAKIGEVIDVDTDENGVGWGKYLRVRIRVNIRKPLARGRKLKLAEETVWTHFQYERLPKICFRCGVIQHGEKGCSRWEIGRIHGSDERADFGVWMRASSPKRGPDRGWRATVDRRFPASMEVRRRGSDDRCKRDGFCTENESNMSGADSQQDSGTNSRTAEGNIKEPHTEVSRRINEKKDLPVTELTWGNSRGKDRENNNETKSLKKASKQGINEGCTTALEEAENEEGYNRKEGKNALKGAGPLGEAQKLEFAEEVGLMKGTPDGPKETIAEMAARLRDVFNGPKEGSSSTRMRTWKKKGQRERGELWIID
jgi:hypothetical protein